MQLSNIKPITILVRFDNELGDQEARYAGYLTGTRSGMYVLPEHGDLIFVLVEETEEPGVYLDLTGWAQIGNIYDADEGMESESIIAKLVYILHNMTAYDFLAKVLVHVRDEFDYEGLLIPQLINEHGGDTNGKARHIGD